MSPADCSTNDTPFTDSQTGVKLTIQSKLSAGILIQLGDEALELFDTSTRTGVGPLRRRIANAVGVVPMAPLEAVIEPGHAGAMLASQSAISLCLDERITAFVRGHCREARRFGFVRLAVFALHVEVQAEQRRYREQRGGYD